MGETRASRLVFRLDAFIAIIRFNYIRPAISLRSAQVISIRYKYRASFVLSFFHIFSFPFERIQRPTMRSGASLSLFPPLAGHVSELCRRRHNDAKFNHRLAASHELRGIMPPACQIFAKPVLPRLVPSRILLESAHRRQMSLASKSIDRVR